MRGKLILQLHGNKFFTAHNIPAKSVGTAPGSKAAAGRMNEVGDMMFYGSFNKDIAKAEVGKNQLHPNYPATIGEFKPNKMFRLVDLSKIDNWKKPSVFDIEHQEERSMWIFLQEFTRRISSQIVVSDSDPRLIGLNHSEKQKKISEFKALEYKPTQVLTKYIQRYTDFKGIE